MTYVIHRVEFCELFQKVLHKNFSGVEGVKWCFYWKNVLLLFRRHKIIFFSEMNIFCVSKKKKRLCFLNSFLNPFTARYVRKSLLYFINVKILSKPRSVIPFIIQIYMNDLNSLLSFHLLFYFLSNLLF